MLALHGGARGRGAAWPHILTAWGHLLPPYPGELVPSVRTPPPPTLDSRQPVRARMAELARAYRTAVDHHFGWCSEFPRVTAAAVASSSHASVLATAADLLVGERRPPVAWASFSCGVWLRYFAIKRGRRRSLPPVRWVYDQKRIRNQTEFYYSVTLTRYRNRMHLVPAHKALIATFEHMKGVLVAEVHGLDEQRVIEIVSAFFPRGSFESRVAHASEQAITQQENLNRDMARGAFVW